MGSCSEFGDQPGFVPQSSRFVSTGSDSLEAAVLVLLAGAGCKDERYQRVGPSPGNSNVKRSEISAARRSYSVCLVAYLCLYPHAASSHAARRSRQAYKPRAHQYFREAPKFVENQVLLIYVTLKKLYNS